MRTLTSRGSLRNPSREVTTLASNIAKLAYVSRPSQTRELMREHQVVFQDLAVQGSAAGVAYGSTVGDFFRLPLKIKDSIVNRKKAHKNIISGFTGSVRPGEMLLVLGRPGAGCSTLLKTLANYTDSYDSVTGYRDYDGMSPAEMAKHFSGELAYLPEDDIHFPLLTVSVRFNLTSLQADKPTAARLCPLPPNRGRRLLRRGRPGFLAKKLSRRSAMS